MDSFAPNHPCNEKQKNQTKAEILKQIFLTKNISLQTEKINSEGFFWRHNKIFFARFNNSWLFFNQILTPT
jgi:hypothetical protein